MKINNDVIERLQIFAAVSDAVVLVPGKKQIVISQEEDLLVEVSFEEPFPDMPEEIAFSNVLDFVGIAKRMDNPQAAFEKDRITLIDSNTKIVYKLYNPDLIKRNNVTPYSEGYDVYKGGIESTNESFSFLIQKDTFAKYLNFANLNGLPHTKIFIRENKVYMKGFDLKDKHEDSNTVEVFVCDIEADEEKEIVIETNCLLKVFKTDYNVTVDGDGFIQLENDSLKYTITEADQ